MLPSILKLALAFLCLSVVTAQARQLPQTHNGDNRLLHFHYEQDDVFQLDLNFRFITMIQFERGETVKAIQIGDSESFQVSRLNRGDVITIKPLIADARTNMNIITSKRVYTFFVRAVALGRPEGQNFRIAFKYGNDHKPPTFVEATSGTKATGKRVNTKYKLSGKADFAPVEVFDDGVNTWLRYTARARRPAVFETNSKGEEAVINYTSHPNHVVQLHGLSDNWTLRIGAEIICIRKAE